MIAAKKIDGFMMTESSSIVKVVCTEDEGPSESNFTDFE